MEISQSTTVMPSTTNTPVATDDNETTISSDFETFLRMLTVQLENQDPLNPIESSDYAVQLATFSGVEQQVLTNDLLKQMSQPASVGENLANYAGWVGMEARVDAPVGYDGSPVDIYPTIRADADRAVLVVRDGSGAQVLRQAIPLGTTETTWAGTDSNGATVAPGAYDISVEAYSGETLLGTDPVYSYAKVEEVAVVGAEPQLTLEGVGQVLASKVAALRAPVSE